MSLGLWSSVQKEDLWMNLMKLLFHEILSFPDATLMSSVFQTVGSDVLVGSAFGRQIGDSLVYKQI